MKQVLIIGGGVAGMEASAKLSEMGFGVSIVEKSNQLGGKLNRWDRLFPDFSAASDLLQKITINKNTRQFLNTEVLSVHKNNNQFDLSLSNGEKAQADAILVSTGFDVFDARKKEEYGYGIYDNVITSADLEDIFKSGKKPLTQKGENPKRIGIIHCVGSRDEKAGHTYCSKVCCVTAVKQAVELKEALPDTEVFCFYMDLRMFGRHFEELYKKAQMQHGVQFIRGRLSEASENKDGSLTVKVEDTLLGKPLKMTVDMLVLMVGMVPEKQSTELARKLNINIESDGFLANTDMHYSSFKTNQPGIFTAGTSKGPKKLENTINEARAAALEIAEYLK